MAHVGQLSTFQYQEVKLSKTY